MQNIYKTYEVDNKLSENYKGSLLERADKEGWKVTVLKPQSKASERFIKDKFRDDFPGLFETPDKELVAMGGDYDGFTGDWTNNADEEDLEEAIYEVINTEELLEELTPRQRQVAELRLQGFNDQEIAGNLNITDRAVRRIFQRIKNTRS